MKKEILFANKTLRLELWLEIYAISSSF